MNDLLRDIRDTHSKKSAETAEIIRGILQAFLKSPHVSHTIIFAEIIHTINELIAHAEGYAEDENEVEIIESYYVFKAISMYIPGHYRYVNSPNKEVEDFTIRELVGILIELETHNLFKATLKDEENKIRKLSSILGDNPEFSVENPRMTSFISAMKAIGNHIFNYERDSSYDLDLFIEIFSSEDVVLDSIMVFPLIQKEAIPPKEVNFNIKNANGQIFQVIKNEASNERVRKELLIHMSNDLCQVIEFMKW